LTAITPMEGSDNPVLPLRGLGALGGEPVSCCSSSQPRQSMRQAGRGRRRLSAAQKVAVPRDCFLDRRSAHSLGQRPLVRGRGLQGVLVERDGLMMHVSVPPQGNGKLDRFRGTRKSKCALPKTPLSLGGTRRTVGCYVRRRNYVLLHSTTGYVVTRREPRRGSAPPVPEPKAATKVRRRSFPARNSAVLHPAQTSRGSRSKHSSRDRPASYAGSPFDVSPKAPSLGVHKEGPTRKWHSRLSYDRSVPSFPTRPSHTPSPRVV